LGSRLNGGLCGRWKDHWGLSRRTVLAFSSPVSQVLPRYAAAVERYGGLQFTSSLGKYLKYDAKPRG